MKKTLNINLGGLAFIIDENAFELLHNYLEALKAKFKNATERDEILNDIEARIAEMLSQKLVSRREVVSLEDVQSVTAAMGKPEDIAGEETETVSSGSSTEQTRTAHSAPVARRLFRDPDDEKVAGVISGLCHYFGINDPTWVRLAVVLLCFVSFGTVLLVYILLAIVIPKAQTSAEKLQMKGEPVNISTIEKEITGATNRAGESVNKFIREQTFFEKLWGVFAAIVKTMLKIVAAFVIFIGSIILFVLIAGLFGVTIAGNALLAHAPHFLIDNTTAISLLKFGAILFIAAPVIALIYAALRLILGKRTQAPWLKWVLIAAWWGGVFLLSYGGYYAWLEVNSSATKTEQTALAQPANGHLFVQLTDSLGNKISPDEEDFSFSIQPNGVFVNGVNIEEMEQIPVGEPWVELMPSANDSFYVQTSISARGKHKTDALANTGYVIYRVSQSDTVLSLPDFLFLDRTGKYRAQAMRIRIAIPEGKFVSFANNIDHGPATVRNDDTYNDTKFANTTWTVKDGKVICIKGENHFDIEDEEVITEEISGFEKDGKKYTKRVQILKDNDDALSPVEEKLNEVEEKLNEAGEKMEKKIIKIEKKLNRKDDTVANSF